MQTPLNVNRENPLAGLVSREIYDLLEANDLLSEKAVRDYQMRKRFRFLRNEDVPASDAIERLREDHPYLQFDTIRKIVYKLNR